MIKKYVCPLLIILAGCQTPYKKADGIQYERVNPVDSISINTTQHGDTAIHLTVSDDTAYFKNGEVLLVKSYIRPKTTISSDSINPKEISDEVCIIANCLIIIRNIKSAGHFCHIPEVEKVEIYTQNGNSYVINNGDSKSESLMGFDFTCNFLGNRFSSPFKTWGLIAIEAEGSIRGYLIINPDGIVKEINTSKEIWLEGMIGLAEFNEKDELVWPDLTEDSKPVKFIVNSKGEYRIVKN